MGDQIKKYVLILIFIVSAVTGFGQSATYRGYYLKDVNSWLGNTAQENTILNYTAGNGYTYIIFYDLGSFNFNDINRKNLLLSCIVDQSRNFPPEGMHMRVQHPFCQRGFKAFKTEPLG